MASGARRFDEVRPKLRPETLQVIEKLGFTTMTPVQAATIPLFLTNKDVAVEAVTGSGKTLAFVVPVMEMLARDDVELAPNQVGSIILSPTRELARQIFSVLSLFISNQSKLSAVQLIGGTDVNEDVEACQRGGHIIVGTPGRVYDVLKRPGGPSLRTLEVLVMDEADTLLDLGFSGTINSILAMLPKQRRTGVFSATQTQEVKELARAGLRNPVVVSVKVQNAASKAVQKTPTQLDNFFVMCNSDEKLPQLVHHLQANPDAKVIVFFMTCACVDFFVKALQLVGVADKSRAIVGLHGRMPQKRRVKSLRRFRDSTNGIMCCTDVAARGIDLPDINWIIQFDPPKDPNFFVHRVGRTARAGRSGKALVYLLPTEDTYVHFLALHKVPICRQAPVPDVADVLPTIKKAACSDRDVLEKGTKAFVSFIRGYKEHDCRFIFRYSALDIAAVARSFALLRLPHMSDFRGTKIDFTPEDIDTSAIKFADAAREKQRQRRMKRDQEEKRKAAEERRARKQRRLKQAQQPAKARKRKHKGKHAEIMAEWEELAEEERLARRVRKGKLSRLEFDKQMYAADDDLEALLAFDREQERIKKERAKKQRQQAAVEQAKSDTQDDRDDGASNGVDGDGDGDGEGGGASDGAGLAHDSGDAVDSKATSAAADTDTSKSEKRKKKKKRRRKKKQANAVPEEEPSAVVKRKRSSAQPTSETDHTAVKRQRRQQRVARIITSRFTRLAPNKKNKKGRKKAT